LEIVVVEDGSESDLADWVEKLALENIRYVRHDKNRGLAAARNTGLEMATGVYVAYIDDDDEWLPTKLTRQVAYLQEAVGAPEVIYCGAEVVSPDGTLINRLVPRLYGNIRKAIEEKGLYTIPSSCLFHREALAQIDGYDEKLFSHIDHDIWLTMARENYSAAYIDECLVRVYQHRNKRMTSDDESRIQATDIFCQKWFPYLADWFGERNAHQYCARFRARVMAMLGWSNLETGNRWNSFQQFLTAIRYHPGHARHYRGLFACLLGYPLYDRLASWIRCLQAGPQVI
jgi:glycosyltransferase involved in cell wall biosynthesis